MSVIGLRVGPFEIVEPARVPEPGDWYRARRTGMTRRQPTEVLVRLLAPDADPAARAALQHEYDSLRAMEDARVPAAVALYEGIGALAMDAPDGVGLDEIIEERRLGTLTLTPATLLDLALEIAETLQHAHHRNRQHGHLHAGLIRLSMQGKLHVFGFAQGPLSEVPAAWASPERVRGEPPTPSTDQWSLASILCALISGAAPWPGETPRAAALTGDPEPIVEPIERQWPALARLFRRMLQPDPNNRQPSMQPVRQELLALARKAGGTSERRELAQLMARRVGRKVQDDLSVAPSDPPSSPDDVSTVDAVPFVIDPPTGTEGDPSLEVDAEVPAPPQIPTPALTAPTPAPTAPTPAPAVRLSAPAARLTPAPAGARVGSIAPPVSRAHLPVPPEPTQAAREEAIELAPMRPSPLVSEALTPVFPVLAGEDVPRARRDDEDISDDPTVRYDPRMLEGLAADPSPPVPRPAAQVPVPVPVPVPVEESDPDLENSEVSLSPPDFARALAVAPSTPVPQPSARAVPSPGGYPAFGEGPTAVPATDVSDDGPSGPLERTPPSTPAASPRSLGTPVITPVRVEAEPRRLELQEPVDAVRTGPIVPARSAAQTLAPWLVVVMIVLMLVLVAAALW